MKQQYNTNFTFTEFKLGDNKSTYYLQLEDIHQFLTMSKTAFKKQVIKIKQAFGSSHVIKYKNDFYISQFGFEQLIMICGIMRQQGRTKNAILSKYRNKNSKNKNAYIPRTGLKPGTKKD